MDKEHPPAKKSRVNSQLAFAILSAAFGSAFQHGYNTGVLNAPKELIEKWIHGIKVNRSLAMGETGDVSEESVTLIFSLAVSLFCVGGMVGGCSVGFVAERFGRKMGILLNNILVLVAVLAQSFAKAAGSYELLLIGRFVIGVNAGLSAGLVPLYITEISPVDLRGAVGTVYQLVITVSILLSQICGLEVALGTEDHWPLVFAVTAVPALMQVVMLPICPESPKHLLTRGQDEKSNEALVWLRGTLSVEDEFDVMKAQEEAENMTKKVTLFELTRNPSLRMPLIIASVVMVAQQFSGINAAIYFSTDIFMKAHLSEKEAQFATMGMGTLNVLMTIVSLFLVERAGRKTLLITGFLGMFSSTLFLFVCLFNSEIVGFSYMSIAAVFLVVLFFSIGPGSIPWFLVAELFSQQARPAATGVAVVVNWTANFIVGIGFLPLVAEIGSWVFVIFAAMQVLFAVFVYRKVPETKNKSPEEIAAYFRQTSYQ
ncbi:solute carrier family 2, facilitated glucose transporter member 1-like [Cimex lectularius]|uniref:Major facilitator superfamily (MFS) profile domain-containing protein n=1 Tax=Cimex lectularius TaxID=79782 RepID=A0A8I6S6S5_CIMLE|nr:solute carrier family 2, facilitated glucose transporter member 1-like [Cimex lectularius]